MSLSAANRNPSSPMTTFVLKVEHNGILRRFNAPINQDGELDLKFDDLKAKIVNLFEFPLDAKLGLTYIDEDGDIVTLANDEDLRDVFTQNLKFLKISVALNGTNEPKRGDPTRNDISPSLNTIPEAVKETINQVISKVLLELPSKASSSTQIATELCDSFSKLGLSFLKNIPNMPPPSQNKETNSASGSYETPNVPTFPACPFSGTPPERSPIPSKLPAGAIHIGIVCDECGANPIIGVRYKSQIAHDFDLCETCFAKKGNPTDYEKMETPIQKCPFKGFRSSEYVVMPPYPAVACHVGVTCDGCNVHPIIGTRYKSKEKFDYDLCQACFSKTGNPTSFERFETPIIRKAFGLCQGIPYAQFPIPQPVHLKRHGKAKLDSRFITDVNVLDGTVISPGASFTKIWRLRNNGSIRWPRGTRLMWIGGDKLTDTQFVDLEIPDLGLPLEKEIDIAVDFSAPLLPGRYISYWRLVSPFGHKFGQRVWVLIQVVESADKVKDMNDDLNAEPESNPVEQTESNLVSYPKLEGEPVRVIEETDPVLEELGFREVDPKVDGDEKSWDLILKELSEMGFCDKEQNLKLLKKHDGSITAVVMDLLSNE